jgi:hypothetical protein
VRERSTTFSAIRRRSFSWRGRSRPWIIAPAEGDARSLAEICRRLDGSPLAIELVSSRFSGRTADTVLSELDDRFRVLRGDRPDVPLRQRTLLITLEWSYALLTREEAAVLRAVSIFAGAFDVQAAARVVEHHGLSPSDAHDAIGGLRSKSMLSIDQASGDLRYRLLDSTRAYAGGLLDGSVEREFVSASHAGLQLETLTRTAEIPSSLSSRNRRVAHGAQVDDLRKALDWALHRSGDTLLGIRLAAAGLPLWQELSLGEEGRRTCERALAEFERIGCTDKSLKLGLVVGLASLSAYLTTDVARIIGLFETARQLARETGNAPAECSALSAVATFSLLPGQDETVSGTLDELRDVALRSQDRAALWEQEKLRAWLEVYLCRFEPANRRLIELRRGMAIQEDGAAPRFHVDQKSSIDIQYGALQWLMGRPGHAVEVIEATADYAFEHGHGLSLVHALTRGIIFTLLECHHYDRARHYTGKLRDVIIRHGLATWLPLLDCYSASIDALSGSRDDAGELREVLKSLRGGTAQLANNTYCSTLARAMLAIGRPEDAAVAVGYVREMGGAALEHARAAAYRSRHRSGAGARKRLGREAAAFAEARRRDRLSCLAPSHRHRPRTGARRRRLAGFGAEHPLADLPPFHGRFRHGRRAPRANLAGATRELTRDGARGPQARPRRSGPGRAAAGDVEFAGRPGGGRHSLAGAPGFEPGNGGTKNRCLTAWRRPMTVSRCGALYGSARPCAISLRRLVPHLRRTGARGRGPPLCRRSGAACRRKVAASALLRWKCARRASNTRLVHCNGGMPMAKWVYGFGGGKAEGGAGDRNLLGGKGANLAEMSGLGLPVPPGFTITTELCTWYYANGRTYPADLDDQVDAALDEVGRLTGKRFGDPARLLLVSVRSGGRASMPGMMDTVLNLGLNDETVEALARDAGDRRFAYDSYRRFIQMYCDVVLGLDHEVFEEILEDQKARLGVDLDTEIGADDWVRIVELYKARVFEELERPFPQDPREQLWGAIGAVFQSWMNPARHHLPPPARHPPRAGAPPSTSRPWCSATWATRPPPASPSPATRRPARTGSTASSSSTRKGKTWWPASARRRTSPRPPASPPAPTSPRSKS